MPTAFFFCPYKRRILPGFVGVYPAVDDFTQQIRADGGDWRELETLGGYCIVKVRASSTTLTDINSAPGFDRIPLSRLDDPTSTMTSAQRTAILNRLQALGFTNSEITARFPLGWDGPYTLRDIILFAISRRQEIRYDSVADQIVWNGKALPASNNPDYLEEVTDN